MGQIYIHTFIYERSFAACKTCKIWNFTLEYTQSAQRRKDNQLQSLELPYRIS